ncbi:histidinol-phosphatase [Nocardioides insulae]|uniref:histidinol-phosphatase n=1 Tax=Nocardioides insulae TaxID=394734 RepID=UPI0003F93256|nr:histidinol-phosphatase [Nocardioides insulae]
MSHHPDGHSHDHAAHGHSHEHSREVDDLTLAASSDASDRDLTPAEVNRRGLLRAAGITGALTAGIAGMTGISPAMAEEAARRRGTTDRAGQGDQPTKGGKIRHWLAGDHHIHTQYSSDGQYTVLDQAQHGAAYGLDWMVITDHGGPTHAHLGVDLVNPDILAARDELDGTLIFQGLEWNIPAAEHGTVFVAPGKHEVAVLKQFENKYDGSVRDARENTAENEALAVAGIQWLGQQKDKRRVEDALFLANHPARNGIDSPHEVRAWRDADDRIAVGWEGAPGHQAGGLPTGYGPGSARGAYGNSPSSASFPGYPPESYRSWGGFDFYTSTVGGLWDSLLAEGKPWSISANSDSHRNWGDTSARPDGSTSEQFDRDGRYGNPVYGGAVELERADFWPGFYSRTHVGAASRDYTAVMKGIRDGRVWVDHGNLVKQVDVRVLAGARSETLGGTLLAKRGSRVRLEITITAQDVPNWAMFTPKLNRVDLIRGAVDPFHATSDRDTLTAPDTKVIEQTDTSGREGTFTLRYDLGELDEAFYVRLRGTDANRSQVGYLGDDVDPAGPAIDVVGDADPWTDLWFYTNPIWVLPSR